MKQNVLLSALLAAMLMIAGCGGGSSSAPPTGPVENTEQTPPDTNAPPAANQDAYSAQRTAMTALADLSDPDNVQAIHDAKEDLEEEIARLRTLPADNILRVANLDELEADLVTVNGYINVNIKQAFEAATVASGASYESVRDNPEAIARAIANFRGADFLAIFEASNGAYTGSTLTLTPATNNMMVHHPIGHANADAGRSAYDMWLDAAAPGVTPATVNRANPTSIHNVKEYGRDGMTFAEILGGTATMIRIDDSGSDQETTSTVPAVAFSRRVVADPGAHDGSMIHKVLSGTVSDIRITHTSMGIKGRLYCIGSGCRGTQGDGRITLSSANSAWYFVPTGVEERRAGTTWVDLDGDGNYELERGIGRFGYWLDTSDPDPDVLNTFAYHDLQATRQQDIDLEIRAGNHANFDRNTATYSGEAVGLYAWERTATVTVGGEFEADVNLTANFTGAATSTIGGTLTNFRTSAGGTVGNAWSVTLAPRQMTNVGAITGGTTTTSSGGFGEGVHATGWRGQMYGNEADTGAGAGDNEGDNRPVGILGQFDAVFRDGYASGAFGAEKD